MAKRQCFCAFAIWDEVSSTGFSGGEGAEAGYAGYAGFMWSDTPGGDELMSVDDLPEDVKVLLDEKEECCTLSGIVGGLLLDGTTGGGGGGGEMCERGGER